MLKLLFLFLLNLSFVFTFTRDDEWIRRLETLETEQNKLQLTVKDLQELVLKQQYIIQQQQKEMERLLKHAKIDQELKKIPQKRLTSVSYTPVAFSAYLNHGLDNLSPSAVLPFEMVTTNEGNAFNGNTGVFTCPTSGMYLFVWNIMVDTGHNTQVYLAVNGAKRRWSYAVSTGSYANAANHDIVRLEEGDKVWIADDYTSGEIHPHHTTFSGVLLYE